MACIIISYYIIIIIIISEILNLFSSLSYQVAVFWQVQISTRDQSALPQHFTNDVTIVVVTTTTTTTTTYYHLYAWYLQFYTWNKPCLWGIQCCSYSAITIYGTCNAISNMIYVLYFYFSTSYSMCAVPNMAVLCSSLILCFPGMLLRYSLNGLGIISTCPYYYWYIIINSCCRGEGGSGGGEVSICYIHLPECIRSRMPHLWHLSSGRILVQSFCVERLSHSWDAEAVVGMSNNGTSSLSHGAQTPPAGSPGATPPAVQRWSCKSSQLHSQCV